MPLLPVRRLRGAGLAAALVLALGAAAPAHAGAPGQVAARPAADADRLQRRLDHALWVREALRARWMERGAIPRPPRPEPLAEEPGEPPVPGARWVDGAWAWHDGQWRWRDGQWLMPHDGPPPDVALDAAGALVGLTLEALLDRSFVHDLERYDRDHRRGRTGTRIRDHRGDDGERRIRDHRTSSRDDDDDDERKAGDTRDHRGARDRDDRPAPAFAPPPPGGGGTVRDHRRR